MPSEIDKKIELVISRAQSLYLDIWQDYIDTSKKALLKGMEELILELDTTLDWYPITNVKPYIPKIVYLVNRQANIFPQYPCIAYISKPYIPLLKLGSLDPGEKLKKIKATFLKFKPEKLDKLLRKNYESTSKYKNLGDNELSIVSIKLGCTPKDELLVMSLLYPLDNISIIKLIKLMELPDVNLETLDTGLSINTIPDHNADMTRFYTYIKINYHTFLRGIMECLYFSNTRYSGGVFGTDYKYFGNEIEIGYLYRKIEIEATNNMAAKVDNLFKNCRMPKF